MNEEIIKEINELDYFEMSELVKEFAISYASVLLGYGANFKSFCMSKKFDAYVNNATVGQYLYYYKYVLDYSYKTLVSNK